MNARTTLRVGIDIVSVDEIANSIERFGDSYLQRVFTPHELQTCIGAAEVRASRLAARFAAKEAVMKVLRPDDHTPAWREIEVWRHEFGWCEIRLHGSAATLADRAGLGDLAVSITHDKGVAAAVVVTAAADPTPGPDA